MTVMLAVGLCGVVVAGSFYLRARWDPFPRSDLRMEGDWPLQRDDEIGFAAAHVLIADEIERAIRAQKLLD